MHKIMIIEDEPDIREELTLLLKNEGYQVTALTEFINVGVQVKTENPDLILLDVGLPGRDGFSICMDIRKVSQIPIIFVTSRDSSMDELKALSLGGDDYVAKPYNIPVLIARIKAVLRRKTDAGQGSLMEVNGLRLNLPKGSLEHDGQVCEATKNELKILSCLMARPGEIVSRADLIEYLWNNHIYIDDNTLSVNVTRLRAKLSDLGLPDYITTKWGMGYKI